MISVNKLLAVAGFVAVTQVHAAPVPVLSFPGSGYVTYGDFRSYSMPILDWASGGQYMFNTANTIQDALVVGTGSGGNTNNQDLGLPNVSDGFNFPNNLPKDTTADWSTSDTSTHKPDDARTYWSISLESLRKFLTFDGLKHDMVAYFNNNQDNKNDPAADGTLPNNLWAWAQIDLVGSNPTQSFYLKNVGSGSRTQFGHGDYVLSGGPVTLCFSVAANQQSLANEVPCDGSGGTVLSTKEFQHNLGQNDVSYALFSDVLNTLLWSTDFTEMRVRVDFLDLNNGFENMFIAAACVGEDGCTAVPEPNSLALVALAVAALGWSVRRRNSAA